MATSTGKTVGTIVGLVVAVVAAYFTYGASLAAIPSILSAAAAGASIGGAIGSAIDPPKSTALGPNSRLNDLSVQTATYGAFIGRIYGVVPIFGNIFWVENNALKESTLAAEGKGGKSSGGVGYSYSATFALGLCQGPIIGIKRMWIGPVLFYDIGSSDAKVLIKSIDHSRFFKVYNGDDTQLPDPRMQAALGINDTPSYRGLAYIAFYDLPLDDYGNSLVLSQIKVEVVAAGAKGYIYEQKSSVANESGADLIALVGNNYAYTAGYFADFINIWNISDPVNPELVYQFTPDGGSIKEINVDNDLHYLYLISDTTIGPPDTNTLYIYSVASPDRPLLTGSCSIPTQNYALAELNGHVMTGGSYSHVVVMINATDPGNPFEASRVTGISNAVCIRMYFDYAYVIDRDNSRLYIIDILDIYAIAIIATLQLPEASAESIDITGTIGYVRYALSEVTTIVDLSFVYTPAIIGDFNAAGAGGPMSISAYYTFIGRKRDVSTLEVWDMSDPAAPVFLATLTEASAGGGYGFQRIVTQGYYAYSVNTANGNLEIYFYIKPVIAGDLVPLSEIVEAETLQSNLLVSSDVDVTTLTPLVRGFRISSLGTLRSGIEKLQGAWPFDVIQYGYKIKYILRGTASVDTVPATALDARAAGEKPGVQITNMREMDSILPQKVSIDFFDVDREYDNGEQYAERINTDALNAVAIAMPIVFNSEEAAQKAEVLLYLYWMERYDLSFVLGPEYLHLEPADVITINADDATYIVRLTSIHYTADGRLECGGKYNEAAIYISAATGAAGTQTGVAMALDSDTVFELLDIPLMLDTLNLPGFPVAMAGYESYWIAGVLFQSSDQGQTWEAIKAFTAPGSTLGTATTALSAHGGTDIDAASVLTVRMIYGELSSISQAQMFNGSNWFAYGANGSWEIIAAQNCTLQGDGSYHLSMLLRGQRGTEWASGLHVQGDHLVLLSRGSLQFEAVNSSDINVEKFYRGISHGQLIDSDVNHRFTYTGVNLKPLSGVHPYGSRNVTTNDWTLNWFRRSRFDSWLGGVDALMGEAVEAYEIDIYSDDTFTTVLRTLTASTPSVVYIATQQGVDFPFTSAHSYWRLFISSVQGGPNTGLYELYLRTSPGGAQAATGGTAIASGSTGGWLPAYAFDGNTTKPWYDTSTANKWIGYHFAAPVSLVEIAMIGTGTNSPATAHFDYSDDGVTWSTFYNLPTQSGWDDTATHTFTLPANTVATIYAKIYQLSAIIGRGYPLTATFGIGSI